LVGEGVGCPEAAVTTIFAYTGYLPPHMQVGAVTDTPGDTIVFIFSDPPFSEMMYEVTSILYAHEENGFIPATQSELFRASGLHAGTSFVQVLCV
jgi:hypothetical protein